MASTKAKIVEKLERLPEPALQKILELAEILQEERINNKKNEAEDDPELKQLHEQFDWLVADIGVKEPLTRSQIYEIE